MHPNHRRASGQAQRIRHYAGHADSYALFNLLTGPQLFDRLESSLPEHRERLFPPTETLSLFLAQALSADGSCRQVVTGHSAPFFPIAGSDRTVLRVQRVGSE
jgi:hypothetical protein